MKRFLIACLVLVGCASAELEAPPSSGALALHADKAVPADISAAFAREVSARFPGQHGADAMRTALAAQGFQCADKGASPEVRVGEVYAQCTLPKPHGLCSDKWVVDLRLKQLTRALDFAQVAPEGRFERFCTGGASPNG